MDRRRFIATGLALLAYVWPGGFTHARLRARPRKSIPPEEGDVILDMSGAYGEGAIVVGVLTGMDYAAGATEIARLRSATKFRCVLDYAGRNRHKLTYAKRLVDSWLDGRAWRIDLLVHRDTSTRNPVPDSDTTLAREADIVAGLLGRVPVLTKGRHRLLTQRHFQGLRQDRFEEMLLRREASLGPVRRIHASQNDLAQLLDFVVGSVRADQEKIPKPATKKVKRELNAYLAARLGVPNLRQPVSSARCTLAFA